MSRSVDLKLLLARAIHEKEAAERALENQIGSVKQELTWSKEMVAELQVTSSPRDPVVIAVTSESQCGIRMSVGRVANGSYASSPRE